MTRIILAGLLIAAVFGCGQSYHKYEGEPFNDKVPRDWENPS